MSQAVHRLFHVVALVSFLAGLAVAFVGIAAPVLFPDGARRPGPALKAGVLLGLGALSGLGADWLAHNL